MSIWSVCGIFSPTLGFLGKHGHVQCSQPTAYTLHHRKPKAAKSTTCWWAMHSFLVNGCWICSQMCLHLDQSKRNCMDCGGSSSFSLGLLHHSTCSLDCDWTKCTHKFSNKVTYCQEMPPDVQLTTHRKGLGIDMCQSFKNGNPGGFVGLGRTPSKASWAWWAGKREHQIK